MQFAREAHAPDISLDTFVRKHMPEVWHYLRACGCDPETADDPAMIGPAKQKAPDLAWIEADLLDVNVRDEAGETKRFDVIVAAGNVMVFLEPGTEGEVIANVQVKNLDGSSEQLSFIDADRETLIFVFTVFMMCRIDWQLTLIVLIPLPLMSLFIVRMAALVHTRFRAIQDFFGDIANFIQENLSGIRVVKAYVRGPTQTRAFDGMNQEYLERNTDLIHTHAVYRPLSFLIASIGLGMNLWLGGEMVVQGVLSIGDFVALNAYLTLLIRPVSYVGWVIDRSQRALVAIRRINDVLSRAIAWLSTLAL